MYILRAYRFYMKKRNSPSKRNDLCPELMPEGLEALVEKMKANRTILGFIFILSDSFFS